jgi:hypothetical protein
MLENPHLYSDFLVLLGAFFLGIIIFIPMFWRKIRGGGGIGISF